VTWTKLSEDFDQHPKIVAAGPMAELLHIHGLLYCNRYLTDGHIPATAVRRLAPNPTGFLRSVERLVELGIWVEVEGGYDVHDFLEYQPSRAKVLAERKQKASAGQAGGIARAKARAQAEGLAKSKPVSVPVSVGSLDPVTLRDKSMTADKALLGGTGLKSPPNGEQPWAEFEAKARSHVKVDS
jgi:hypothetical protein